MHEKNENNKLSTAMVVFMFCMMIMAGMIGSVSAQEEAEHDDDDDNDEDWEDYSAIQIIGIGVFIVLLGIVVIYVGLWIYRDANSRGLDGTLWLIIMFVGNIIGLIIYFIIRKDHPVRTSPLVAIPLIPVQQQMQPHETANEPLEK